MSRSNSRANPLPPPQATAQLPHNSPTVKGPNASGSLSSPINRQAQEPDLCRISYIFVCCASMDSTTSADGFPYAKRTCHLSTQTYENVGNPRRTYLTVRPTHLQVIASSSQAQLVTSGRSACAGSAFCLNGFGRGHTSHCRPGRQLPGPCSFTAPCPPTQSLPPTKRSLGPDRQ